MKGQAKGCHDTDESEAGTGAARGETGAGGLPPRQRSSVSPGPEPRRGECSDEGESGLVEVLGPWREVRVWGWNH